MHYLEDMQKEWIKRAAVSFEVRQAFMNNMQSHDKILLAEKSFFKYGALADLADKLLTKLGDQS